jgi:hypothetical protein
LDLVNCIPVVILHPDISTTDKAMRRVFLLCFIAIRKRGPFKSSEYIFFRREIVKESPCGETASRPTLGITSLPQTTDFYPRIQCT